jgi:diguanylate cyclase (GGDEF)-like protein
MYCVASASAAATVLYGVAKNRPEPRLPWLFLAASQVVYAAADTTFYVSHYLLGSIAYPSLADPLYIAHYPLVVAALTLLIRRRTPGGDLPSLLDAAVLAVVAAMLSWLYLIGPQARADSPLLVKLTSLTYPVMDLAMLAVALRLILGVGRRPAAFFLLSTNLVAIFTADTSYVWQQLAGTYHAGNFLDAIWLGGNLALGAAALHPTVAQLGDRCPPRDASLGPARLVALTAAALVAPATLVVQHLSGELRDVPVIAAACAVLFVLTITRLAVLVANQRRVAITDALTGLRTRRFFQSQLPVEVARARRASRPLAVFIIDVDHFKSINDRYGHPAGDQALIEIAGRLKAAARGADLLARYGGEEFALLVCDADPNDLPGIAERLRQRVASQPITVSTGTRVAVTVSVGTACFPLHAEDPNELVAAADRALYAAKARGRDSVVVGEMAGMIVEGAAEHGPAALDYLCHLADLVDTRMSPHEHSRAVGRWAMLVAAEFGAEVTSPHRAGLAGRLHDVGKILLPEAVLAQPGRPDEEEWRLLRQHPDYGYRLVAAVPGMAAVAEIIRQHHERFDGGGYPRGLRGSDIRLEARILAVCDSWAAMLAERAYQPALTVPEARDQLIGGRGSQYDPQVVDAFLDLLDRGHIDRLTRGGAAFGDGRLNDHAVVLGSGVRVPSPGDGH